MIILKRFLRLETLELLNGKKINHNRYFALTESKNKKKNIKNDFS
jgi:hypothetical protein